MTSVIKVENLGKKYLIGHEKQAHYRTLRDSIGHYFKYVARRLRHHLRTNTEETELQEFWALKDINFEYQQGDKAGVIDIDIRSHNRAAIEAHLMDSRIQMIKGSSIAPEVIEHVKRISKNYARILVCLDSSHTNEHVLADLEAYAPLTSVGSYCVAFDTLIEDMPADMFPDSPWGKGDNPQ